MSQRFNWYFDVLSPFAYLQWQTLRKVKDVAIEPCPVLISAILSHLGQRGPAEIPAKRVFTYRLVHFRAAQRGIPLRFPPSHPFNPLPALRLLIAAGCTHAAVDAVMDHLWRDGQPLDQPEHVGMVGASLGLPDACAAIASTDVKTRLRNLTEQALSAGVFGVPTLHLGSELFWGDDATDLALAVARDPELLHREPYVTLGRIEASASRLLP